MNQQFSEKQEKETLQFYLDKVRESYLELARLSNLDIHRDYVEKTDYELLFIALCELNSSIHRDINFYDKYKHVNNSEVK